MMIPSSPGTMGLNALLVGGIGTGFRLLQDIDDLFFAKYLIHPSSS